MTGPVRTCLAYAAEAEEAARFYTSLIPGSRIETVFPAEGGSAVVVNFTLGGAPFQAINAGTDFGRTMSASVSVSTRDQTETDWLWAALLADGGAESRCGWLTDKWGVAWQIVPEALMRANFSFDRAAAARARKAMLTMSKIDIAAIEAAYAGEDLT